MWTSPNHPNPPKQPSAPQEQGERLATFPRGANQELRVCLDHYEGHPFLTLRVWERNPNGEWWPTKRGVSVRLGELDGLVAVLQHVASIADEIRPVGSKSGGHGSDRGASVNHGGSQGPSASRSAAPRKVGSVPAGETADFDEFADGR